MQKKILFLLLAGLLLAACTTQQGAVKEKEEAIVKVNIDPNAPKLCALTFDDGPDAVKTPRVLDKLEAHGVVASFFVIGQLVNSSTQPVLQRAVEMGCEINNHSWGWSSLNNMSAEQIKASVDKTSAAIEQYAGVSPAFFRPPNLAKSDLMFEVIELPFAEGVLAMDWDGQNTTAEQRADYVIKGVRDGAIILMHDVQPDPHPTPEALDILIPALKSQGYEFVTLSELFARKGIDPASQERAWKYVK